MFWSNGHSIRECDTNDLLNWIVPLEPVLLELVPLEFVPLELVPLAPSSASSVIQSVSSDLHKSPNCNAPDSTELWNRRQSQNRGVAWVPCNSWSTRPYIEQRHSSPILSSWTNGVAQPNIRQQYCARVYRNWSITFQTFNSHEVYFLLFFYFYAFMFYSFFIYIFILWALVS